MVFSYIDFSVFMWTHRFGTGWVCVLLLALGVGGVTMPGYAQDRGEIPEISNAELMFEQGLAAYERGEYETAYERFRLVNEFELNRKTTAALLMGGKSLVQLGRYREAIDRLEILLDRYPETTYQEQAEILIERAQDRLQQGGQARDTLRIGVTLPMGGAKVSLSQALFNGVRLAVDEYNGLRRRFIRPPGLQPSADTFEVYDTEEVHGDSLSDAEGPTTVATPTDTARVDSLQVVTEQMERPDWVVKMHFRRTGDNPKSAGAAVDSLVTRDRVDVIVGPMRVRPLARLLVGPKRPVYSSWRRWQPTKASRKGATMSSRPIRRSRIGAASWPALRKTAFFWTAWASFIRRETP